MKPIRLILSLSISVLAAQAFAQQSPAPVPQPPYVAPMPKSAHWIIALKLEKPEAAATPAKPQATPQPIPTTIETIKTGDTKAVVLSYADGKSQRFDKAGPYFLTSSASRAEVFIPHPGVPPYPFCTDGFLFFEKVDPTWFKDVVKIGTVDCFHYQNGSDQRWIAVDSMLPVAATSGGIIAQYQFQPTPTSPIVLPPDEQAALDKEIKAYKAYQSVR